MQDITCQLPGHEPMGPGHLACGGCGAALAMRMVLKGLGANTVLVIPACCWSVVDGVSPFSAAGVPVMHTPVASAAAAASGVRAALDLKGETDTTVCAWAGDGGTFDIGLQALSAAAQRNENILYVCYDNETYIGTGMQRTPPTALGTWPANAPAKEQGKKDLVAIMAAHGVPYVATATIAYPDDLIMKVERAKRVTGLKFLHVLAPCPPGWRVNSADAVRYGRLAVASRVFPLFEVVEGRIWRLTMRPKDVTLEDYLEGQGRFRTLLADHYSLEQARNAVDTRWRTLVGRAQIDPLTAGE